MAKEKALLMVIFIASIFILGCCCTQMQNAINPCEQQYDSCVHNCGDGWGAGLCKSGCTSSRDRCNQCKSDPSKC